MSNILTNLDEIVEHVLHFLPMRSLQSCARVCKKWAEVANRIKRFRRHPNWILHDAESSNEVEQDIQDKINMMSSEPRYALVFCSSGLMESKVAVAADSGQTSSRFPRTAKKERMLITDYLQNLLPSKCQVLGTVTDGIVGTFAHSTKPVEFEGSQAISCLLLPEIEGVQIHHFKISPQSLQQIGSFSMTTHTQMPDAVGLANVTGIPEGVKPKLVLLFQTQNAYILNEDTDLDYALMRKHQQIVVAGGCVDSLIPEEECPSSMTSDPEEAYMQEQTGLGIAFIGDKIKVASVIIDRKVQTREEIAPILKKLMNSHVPTENRIGFMFACIGRGRHMYKHKSVECQAFHSLFPDVPLLGFFGNGETGYDYLPDYATPEGDSNMNLMGEYPDDEAGYVYDMPPVEHSYTTIFVLMSLGK